MVSAAPREFVLEKINELFGGYIPHGNDRLDGPRGAGHGSHTPASLERQRAFEEVFATASVFRGCNSAELHRCPWHDDREASLSIDWTAAVFFCHASSCAGHGGGGIVRLREILGVSNPPRRSSSTTSYEAQPPRSEIDIDALRGRLAQGIYEVLGDFHKSKAVEECGKRYMVGRCPNGHQPAFQINCHVQMCPSCGPWQLAVDWREKIAECPEALHLIKVRSRSGSFGEGSLANLRKQFRHWRDSRSLSGMYGARYEEGLRPAVLLMLPADTPIPDGGKAFEVETITLSATPDQTLRWLQNEYVAETAEAWSTPDELRVLLNDTRGRRRFQGFGDAFKSQVVHSEASGEEHASNTANNLRKIAPSGGAGHGAGHGKAKRKCPYCDAEVEMYTFQVGRDEVERDDQGRLRWLGPTRRAAA